MVDEPLVLLVKLADRLHNLRTLYALAPAKRRAIAEETRGVWCSLAERLGMFALKAEMEDLCFAVLEPEAFDDTKRQLCRFWGLSEAECEADAGPGGCLGGDPGGGDGAAAALAAPAPPPDPAPGGGEEGGGEGEEESAAQPALTAEQELMRRRLASVLPFDAQVYRELAFGPDAGGAPPLPQDCPAFARAGLGTLARAQRALIRKAALDAVAPECLLRLQGRVKSLYSIRRKMRRKGVGVEGIFDALALRVVLSLPAREDSSADPAEEEGVAVAACYRVLEAVQSLWQSVPGEIDDYIANPKTSGYQSLHTAVVGPGGRPFEVQIRTQSMHTFAELGAAAHWLYKEASMVPAGGAAGAAGDAAAPGGEGGADGGAAPAPEPNRGPGPDGADRGGELTEALASVSAEGLMAAVGGTGADPAAGGGDGAGGGPGGARGRSGGIWVGQPVLKVSEARLRDGVVLATDAEGIQGAVLVAVFRVGRLRRESELAGRAGFGEDEMELYERLRSTVELMGWKSPGQGNNSVGIELYVPSKDGRLHKQDPYGYKLKSYVTPLDVLPAGAAVGGAGASNLSDEQQRLQRKCRLMRSMLQWEKETITPVAGTAPAASPPGPRGPPSFAPADDEEVLAILWPGGEFMRLPRGTTAGQVEEAVLLEGGDGVTPSRKTVWVNNRVVPPSTPIADGDLVSLREMTPALSSFAEA